MIYSVVLKHQTQESLFLEKKSAEGVSTVPSISYGTDASLSGKRMEV